MSEDPKPNQGFPLEVAGDPVRVACVFLERLLQKLAEYPDLELEQIVATSRVDLVNLICLLRRNKSLPHVELFFQHFKTQSESDDRLLNYLQGTADATLQDLRANCIEIFGAGANLPVRQIPAFLRAKVEERKPLEQELARLTKEHNTVMAEMDGLLRRTRSDLEGSLRTVFFNPENPQRKKFDRLLEKCRKMGQQDLEQMFLHWKVKFYTKERIAEIKQEQERLEDQKAELEEGIAMAKQKKDVYESLGPEFKQIARGYGILLRDIEVEKRIMSATASP